MTGFSAPTEAMLLTCQLKGPTENYSWFVVRPLGHETIDNKTELPDPPNGGLVASDRGRHGNEGNHHPGSDLHPEVIAGRTVRR